MKDQPEVYGDSERSGTTAVCCILSPGEFFIANLGDSRAILCKSGQTSPFGTEDHKPFLPKERDRIVNAGGSVMIQRVNGSLAVSRALGDYEYKQVPGLLPIEQLVSPEPDVYVLPRDPVKDEFLLLACDGIYDVMTNAELAEFVKSRLQVTHDLSSVGNQILDTCLSKGSKDNMSVVLVTFPAAPSVTDSAQKAEVELHDQLTKRIQGIVSMCEKVSEVETDYVLRILINQDIPGIPPGAGIHAVRSQVEEILEELKAKHLADHPNSGRSSSASLGDKKKIREI
jgi:protein phosphatase 1B